MQRRRGRMLAQGLGLVAAFGVLIALPQTAAEGVRSGLTLCAIPHTRAAALLVQQADVDDLHAAIDRLAHVIDR